MKRLLWSALFLVLLPAVSRADLRPPVTLGNFSVSIATITSLNVSTLTVTSSGTISQLSVSTLTVTGFQGYILLYSSTVCNGNNIATVSNAYSVKVATITVTPKRATSRIEVSWNTTLRSGDALASNVYGTVFRDAQNLATNNGSDGVNFCEIRTNVATASIGANCAGTYIDLPASTSALTYTIQVKNSDDTTSVGSEVTAASNCMTVKEWSY